MQKVKIKIICSLVVLVAFLWLLPSVGLAQSCNATIFGGSSYTSINAAIAALPATPTYPFYYPPINVSGTCNEIVRIPPYKNNINLIGVGPPAPVPTINCFDPNPTNYCATQGTIQIMGKQIIIKGFNITGGVDGIQVTQGGTATIRENNIYSNGRFGIIVVQDSFGTIINNEIYDNGMNPAFPSTAGIMVTDNSAAWIGLLSSTDAVASPNTIQNNSSGIVVRSSSFARIIGNTIIDNTGDGIMVQKVSHADICSNIIDGNGQNGIFVTQNSGVNLGKDTGTTIFDLPNSTTTGNGAYGLNCSIGGYADGRLGTLKGTGRYSATNFNWTCIYTLIP
jgi:parallel beta-helix repeat protein